MFLFDSGQQCAASRMIRCHFPWPRDYAMWRCERKSQGCRVIDQVWPAESSDSNKSYGGKWAYRIEARHHADSRAKLIIKLVHVSIFPLMFLWKVMKSITWTGRTRNKICACNFAKDRFMNSAHMGKLEIITVHEVMLSIHNSSSSSLATLTICAVLLVLVLVVFLAKTCIYLQSSKMQVQYRDRGLCSWPCLFSQCNWKERKEKEKRSIFAQHGSHFVYIGHVPHAIFRILYN